MARTAAGGGIQALEIQNSTYTYAADSAVSDAYAITLSPAVTAYQAGQQFAFKATTANTGSASLNVNSLGAKTIFKHTDSALANNDIKAGSVVIVSYDGVNFQMQSMIANAPAGSGDMVLASTQTNSGLKTFLDTTLGIRNVANTFTSFFTTTAAASRTWTLKDANGTIAFTSDITGTVSTVGFTGGIISVATATTTPALTVAGTSGGIVYFSSASTWATSAALAANAIVIGGGAGVAPSTTTTGTGILTALGTNVGTAGSIVVNGGALGTPSSGTLTSCTGYTVGNLSGLGTNVATALGVNVGSAGAFVTFNGALGTPSSGTVTNLTGTASININGTVGATTPTTGVFTTLVAGSTTSLLLGTAGSAVGNIGFRNATSGTITLAPVAGALGTVTLTLPAATDTVAVLAASQAFTNKTYNGLTLTSTTGTFTLTAAKTLSVTNTLTLSGTDSTVMTFPTTTATIARTDAGQTFTGVQVMTSPSITTANLTGAQVLVENASIQLDPVLSADGTYTGVTITGTAGATLAFGDLIYLAVADSRWELVDADAVATCGAVLTGMCVLAAAADGNATTILLQGNIRADAAFPALTVGANVYAGLTPGDIVTTAPSATDDVVHVVGKALTADSIYFAPSQDYITIV